MYLIPMPDTLGSENGVGKHLQKLMARLHLFSPVPIAAAHENVAALRGELRLSWVCSCPSWLLRKQLVSQLMPKFNVTNWVNE